MVHPEIREKGALEKTFKTLTFLGACRHAPAAVASPSWDIDALPVREITEFQSKSESLYPNAPRPPTGDWWRKRGALYKKRVFTEQEKEIISSVPVSHRDVSAGTC
jgi:hypothetical protein